MGTSVSSAGPGGGVRLVPPWVSDPDAAEPTLPDDVQGEDQRRDEDEREPLQKEPSPIAPSLRFGGASTNFSRFARRGSSEDMRRALGQYVRKGLGTSHWATQRMAGTVRKAVTFYGILNSLSSGTPPSVDLGIDTVSLAGRPVREIMDRIVESLSPSEGTLDSDASRNSITNALRGLLQQDPTANLVALTTEQIELTIELFIGEDICRRIELDVGKTVLAKAPDPATAIRRLEEMYRYVKQVVAMSFRRQISGSRHLTQRTVTRFVSNVIRNVFRVFELLES